MNDHPLFVWRVSHLLLQRQAGAQVGVSQQDWHRYESGIVLPRRAVFRRIVKRTGVTAAAIIEAHLAGSATLK